MKRQKHCTSFCCCCCSRECSTDSFVWLSFRTFSLSLWVCRRRCIRSIRLSGHSMPLPLCFVSSMHLQDSDIPWHMTGDLHTFLASSTASFNCDASSWEYAPPIDYKSTNSSSHPTPMPLCMPLLHPHTFHLEDIYFLDSWIPALVPLMSLCVVIQIWILSIDFVCGFWDDVVSCGCEDALLFCGGVVLVGSGCVYDERRKKIIIIIKINRGVKIIITDPYIYTLHNNRKYMKKRCEKRFTTTFLTFLNSRWRKRFSRWRSISWDSWQNWKWEWKIQIRGKRWTMQYVLSPILISLISITAASFLQALSEGNRWK